MISLLSCYRPIGSITISKNVIRAAAGYSRAPSNGAGIRDGPGCSLCTRRTRWGGSEYCRGLLESGSTEDIGADDGIGYGACDRRPCQVCRPAGRPEENIFAVR